MRSGASRLAAAFAIVATACTSSDDRAAPEISPRAESPAPEPTVPVDSPAPETTVVWTAETGLVRGLLVAGDAVYVTARLRRLLAFDTDCGSGGATCRPAWVAKGGEVTVGDDVVYAASTDGRVRAYPTGCRTDGEACEPLFRTTRLDPFPDTPGEGVTDVLVGKPVIADRRMYVAALELALGGKPEFGRSRLYAFPARCRTTGGPCRPMWRSTGVGAVLHPPTVSGGRVYGGSTRGLHVFPARCGREGATCPPLWRGSAGRLGGMAVDSPVKAGDVVLLSASHGQHGADGPPAAFYAFPASCPAGACDPLWTFRPRTIFVSRPVAAHGRVYAAWDRGVAAFDAVCLRAGGTCEPVWRAARPGRWVRRPMLGDRLVFVSTLSGRLSGYPARCPAATGGDCRPRWSVRLKSRSPWSPVLGDDGTVYFASGRSVYAFPARCGAGGEECEPLWSWTAERRIAAAPVVRRGTVFVAAGRRLYALGPPPTSASSPSG